MPSEFDPYYTWLGIPPEEQPPHHYRLMGLRPLETNRDVITHAMDQRMVYLRSMQAGKHSEESQRLLNEVSAAAIVLFDEEKKAAYDENLRQRLADSAAGSRLPEPRPAEVPPAAQGGAARHQPPAGSAPVDDPQTAPAPRDYVPIIAAVAGVVAILVIVLAVVVVRSLTVADGVARNDQAAATSQQTNPVPTPNPPPPNAAPATAPQETSGETTPPMPPPATSATTGDSPAANPPVTNPAPANPAPPPSPPAPAPANPPPPDPPAAVPTPNEAAAGPAEPSASENALPPADEIQKAQSKLAEIYGNEARQAVKPEQKLALAQKFIQLASETQHDRAAKYALLDAARKLLLAAGEVDLALSTIDSLVEQFSLDPWELRMAAYHALSDGQLSSDRRDKLGAALLDAVVDAVRDEEFDAAEECARLAVKVAGRSSDVNLRRSAMLRRSELTRLKELFDDVEVARAKLEQNPDDPSANLTVGKFLCFVLGDFESGAPLLAKTGQERFAAPASADEAAAGAPGGELKAGDAWYDLAESFKTTEKELAPKALYRARFWYERAFSYLQGLDKARVEKRLQEISGIAPAPQPAEEPTKAKTKGKKGRKGKAKARQPAAAARFNGGEGLIGRVTVDGADAGVLVTYQPGYTISTNELAELRKSIRPGNARIELTGVISLPINSEVLIHHAGGSSSGGVHYLYIDGKEVHAVGDDRTKDENITLALARGEHTIGWLLTGGDLGEAQLEIRAAGLASKLKAEPKILYTPDLEAAVRATSVQREVKYADNP